MAALRPTYAFQSSPVMTMSPFCRDIEILLIIEIPHKSPYRGHLRIKLEHTDDRNFAELSFEVRMGHMVVYCFSLNQNKTKRTEVFQI